MKHRRNAPLYATLGTFLSTNSALVRVPSTNLPELFLPLKRAYRCPTLQVPLSLLSRYGNKEPHSRRVVRSTRSDCDSPDRDSREFADDSEFGQAREYERRPTASEDGEAMPETLPAPSTSTFHEALLRPSKWHAVYTATHHEKHVLQYLTSRGIEGFCPSYTMSRQWKKSKRIVLELPLFPNYLFIRISREQRGAVLGAPGVFSIVGSSREAWDLPDREIEALRSGLHHRNVVPHPYLSVGERARVISGPLSGLEGMIVRDKQNCRIVLTLDRIMRSISIEVDAHELQPLPATVR